MVTLNLLKRPTEGIIVVRDAGALHPPNDIEADRAFSVGEQISVRLDSSEPLRQQSLYADVVGVDDNAVVARARHSVYRATKRLANDPVVEFGAEFRAPRECVFAVWKTRGTSEPTCGAESAVEVQGLILAALRLVDCAVPHSDTRDIVPSEDVCALKRIAEGIEYRLRRGTS